MCDTGGRESMKVQENWEKGKRGEHNLLLGKFYSFRMKRYLVLIDLIFFHCQKTYASWVPSRISNDFWKGKERSSEHLLWTIKAQYCI